MPLPPAGTLEIAPSVLSSDFARLADEVAVIEPDVKIVHLDVMDGHFVPNITFGAPIIKKLRKYSNLCFDTHLMISQPDRYAQDFIDAGADNITFHIEVDIDHKKLIEDIHSQGISASICINPDTPASAIENIAKLCDMVLIMTVHPGFGGQKFIDSAAKKIIEVRKLVGPDIRIQVDGGISPETVQKVVSYGADTLVAGNAIFAQSDRHAAIKAILDAAKP